MAFELREARKFTYDVQTDKWEEGPVRLRMSREPFSEGGMRIAFRAREILEDGSEVDAVVKRIKPGCGLDPEVNFHEAMTQTVAETHAQEFNRACANAGLAHTIAFLPVSVVRVTGFHEPLCLEPYLAGDYVKHSDNAGHSETQDEVAAAFSYFTYISSGKLLVVCDIQGVGTFYTDPQIHTFDGEAFGAGNLGPEGIELFLRSHRHSFLCECLGLPSPDADLTDEELARKLQDAEQQEAMEGMQMFGGMPMMGMPMLVPMGVPSSGWTQQRYQTGFTAIARAFMHR